MAMSRKSAEIYQFPPRGRFAVDSDRNKAEPVSARAAPRLTATFGNWYHEEAIREAARDRKS